jgi:hypothetical protein
MRAAGRFKLVNRKFHDHRRPAELGDYAIIGHYLYGETESQLHAEADHV